MALHGTLNDFGIAEILQLIAQQTKDGYLRLRSRKEEVRIWFEDGNIVAAEQTSGKESHRLGHLLVRAGVITERDLEDALDDQRRTLRRLGDVLVSRGALRQEELEEMARLQATETLYRLFAWKNGSYEFEAGEVAPEKGSFAPIRAEAILMEGFRIVDEWPLIRRRLPSRKVTFEKVATLPDPGDAPPDIGLAERRVYELIQEERTVNRLVELSRLGEFETCKALCNLIAGGYLRDLPPSDGRHPQQKKKNHVSPLSRLGPMARSAVGWILVLLAALGAVELGRGQIPEPGEGVGRRISARIQEARLRQALELHRLEVGRYPATLDEILGPTGLEESDLQRPWGKRWAYETVDEGTGFVVQAPVD